MKLDRMPEALIKKEPKAAFFVGGESDGLLVGMNQHPAYIDRDREPSPIVVPGKKIPAMTKERYFLYPQEILVDQTPCSIYIVQGWDITDVAEYLLMLYIKLLSEPEVH